MRLALRKVPDISKTKLGDLVTAILIDRRYEHTTEEYLAPFCLRSGQPRAQALWIRKDIQRDASEVHE